MKTLRLMLPVLLLATATSACRGDATPTDQAPTEPPPEVAGPLVKVLDPVVQFRETETEDPREVDPGTVLNVEPGANILVGEDGRATLEWPGFLTQEMLSRTDTLLSLSEPALRSAIIDQASGTARYTLQGAGEAADLQIVANWIQVLVDEGEADLIVSFIPGAEPSVWVALLAGNAQIKRQDEMVLIRAGQAMALTEQGDTPQVLEVDRTEVEAWFDLVAAGTAEGTIATVALRCVVASDDVPLLRAPDSDSEPTGVVLARETVVNVLQRDDAGLWLRVAPLAEERRGWVPAWELRCNGPVDNAPTEGPELVDESTPTGTPSPRPRVTFTPRPTLPPLTPTPTASPTAAAEAIIEFSVDDAEIEAGDCTKLRWRVYNIREVYLDDRPALGGDREKKVCPDEDTTYTLKVILRDGSEVKKTVKVEVTGQKAQPTATVTQAPRATATTLVVPTNTPVPATDTPLPSPPPPTATNTEPPPPTATDTPAPAPTDTQSPPDTPPPAPTT